MVERPAPGVPELFEHMMASDQLIAWGTLRAGGTVVGFELSVGTLHDLEGRFVLEVVDQVGREVVSGTKGRVQVRRRRQRHSSHFMERHVISETDNGVSFVVKAPPAGATGHLGILATS